jgi:hypothetical protein
MKNLLPAILPGIFLLLCTRLSAQQSVSYFSDSIQQGPHSRVYCTQKSRQFVYVGGASFDSNGFYYTPSVVKIDTGGHVIWSCTLNKQIDSINGNSGGNFYWSGYVPNMAMDDSSLYAHVVGLGTNTNELWRISTTTGDVIWRRVITDAVIIAVADNNRIAYTYNYGSNYVYELVDKGTGRTVYSATIALSAQSAGSCFLSYDTDGTAYIIKSDSVIKYTDPTLVTVVWNKKIGSPGGLTAALQESDGIYFAGSGQTFFAGKLNKADGSIAWMTYSSYTSYILSDAVSDFKVINNNVYVLGQTMNLTGYSAYHVANFNRTTGHVTWESEYNPAWTPYPNTNGGETSGNSLDADGLGNVYVTGYEAGNNTPVGIWGVVKFDSSGKFKYHSAIFDGTAYTSIYSRGMCAYVYDNRVFYFGELQRSQTPPGPVYNSSYCNVYMVATDTGSAFKPYHQETTRAGYQEFSNVLEISNVSSGKYAVLKQVGFSVSVELRDARNGNVLWSQQVKRGFYLAADKMCVTADNKIAVTAISHRQSQTFYDHSANPDSLYLFSWDTLGNLVTESRYIIRQDQDFRSIQLYPSPDSNTVLVFSQLDLYGDLNSIHIYNFNKATGNIGDYGDYISSLYAPIPGRQRLFQTVSHDTAVHFESYMPYGPSNQIVYRQYTFTNSGGGGWNSANFQLTGLYDVVHNIVPYDSSSIILLATGNSSGTASLIRYSTIHRSTLWQTSDQTSAYSIDMGSCSSTEVYLAGRIGGGLVIRKVRVADGTQVWEKIVTPGGANQYYIPMDQAFNAQRNQYTVAGYIADTTAVTQAQSAFYMTFDTNGNVVRQWMQAGDYKLDNSLNKVQITQFGQTLIGGALYKMPYGRSGVLIEADSPITQQKASLTVTITASPQDSVCSGDSVILVANAAGCNCAYSWSTTPPVNNDTLVVKATGSYTVTASSGTDSATAVQAIVVKPDPPQPVISEQTGMLISSADSGNQWYFLGVPLADSIGQQIRPSSTGPYTVRVDQNGCLSPMSNVFAYPGPDSTSSDTLILYPNPVRNILHIRNRMEIPMHIGLYDVLGRKYAEISSTMFDQTFDMSSFGPGGYYVIITDDKTGVQYSLMILKL